jgi:hypothetical protein
MNNWSWGGVGGGANGLTVGRNIALTLTLTLTLRWKNFVLQIEGVSSVMQ